VAIPVVYRVNITPADEARIRAGHCRMYLTLRRGRPAKRFNDDTHPPQLAFVLVPSGHHMWPTDWAAHSVPLYLEPPPD